MKFESTSVDQALKSNVSPVIAKGFFGNLSGLSQDLLGANPKQLSSLRQQLQVMLSGTHKEQLAQLILSAGLPVTTWPDDFTTINDSTLPKLVAGLVAVLGVVELIQHGEAVAETKQADLRGFAQAAVEWFDKAFCTDEEKREWKLPAEREHDVDWRYKLLTMESQATKVINGSAAGFYCMFDLLTRLTRSSVVEETSTAGWRESSTLVLGAEAGGGGSAIMILTVSLVESDVDCFLPDLRYSGLTELRYVAMPDECLLKSMRRCWKAARLKGRYRGYWRLEHRDIGDMPPDTVIAIPRMHGRSMEAAVMCCLRSAAGNAYDEDLPENKHDRQKALEVDPLQPNVAISAKLGVFESDTPLKDIPLVPVGSVPLKMNSARANRLQTVVFASGQLTKPTQFALEDREELKQFQDAGKKGEFTSGLQFSEVGTVGAALDVLLVRSQWLKAWQKQVRLNWLKRWEARSEGNPGARAPGDDEPGPDDFNQPKLGVANAAASATAAADESAAAVE